MSEMIEEIRLVIHAGLDADLTVEEIARNVIETMREPTDGMFGGKFGVEPRRLFTEMLDAALK